VAHASGFRTEILRRREARPFFPFTIVAKDGRRVEVVEWIRVALGDDFAVVLPPASTSETIRFDDIAAVEPAP
jgi:hypothetical protein